MNYWDGAGRGRSTPSTVSMGVRGREALPDKGALEGCKDHVLHEGCSKTIPILGGFSSPKRLTEGGGVRKPGDLKKSKEETRWRLYYQTFIKRSAVSSYLERKVKIGGKERKGGGTDCK